MRAVLGIDTSNYTTSFCLLGEDGVIISDQRRLLQVASGRRGLRQSEALFQHWRNFPELSLEVGLKLKAHQLTALGVSSRPRPQQDSYLPVFLAGSAFARSLAELMAVPCHEVTHQENHIWGGIASGKGPWSPSFLVIHLSGGTTELAHVQRGRARQELAVDLWGGTSDLHAGQLVDRLGVKLGLEFPAGAALEKLARGAKKAVPVSIFHRDGLISFSGPLTALERMADQEPPEVLAFSCFQVLSDTLLEWIRWAAEKTDCRELLIVGGVAANQLIRQRLRAELPQWNLYFAEPAYSVDNAYGAAYYAALRSGFPVFPAALNNSGKER